MAFCIRRAALSSRSIILLRTPCHFRNLSHLSNPFSNQPLKEAPFVGFRGRFDVIRSDFFFFESRRGFAKGKKSSKDSACFLLLLNFDRIEYCYVGFCWPRRREMMKLVILNFSSIVGGLIINTCSEAISIKKKGDLWERKMNYVAWIIITTVEF